MPSLVANMSGSGDMPEAPKPEQPTPAAAPAAPKSILPQPAKKPLTLRDFGDHNATRKAIYDSILASAQAVPPVSNSRYSLSLEDPHWADKGEFKITDRKRAILRGDSLQRRLRGTWVLKDNTGNTVERRMATIAHVPHMTEQGTFVLNGSDYALGHQMRLRPGVFTRLKENGELESHINVMPGKGFSHHYFLEPETGIFKLNIGQASLPLISVLKAMGASDKEIHAAWGGDKRASKLLMDNLVKDDAKALDKLYARLFGKKAKPDASAEEKRQAVAEEFGKMELDPEVTKRTLGQPFQRISKEMALATTRKLLDVSRGEADTDDRDHLAFQNFLGPEDLFAERVGRDKRLLNELLWKATNKGNLSAVPVGAFTKHVHAALMDSGLGQVLEEVNPAEVFDQQTRVSRLGYGGIPCHSADTEVLTKDGWKVWPTVTMQDELACVIDGELSFAKPQKLFAAPYKGKLLHGATDRIDYLVTPDHRLFASTKTTAAGTTAWKLPTFRLASELHGKACQHRIAFGEYYGGNDQVLFAIPPAPVDGQNSGSAKTDDTCVDFVLWAKFLGYYLADGSFTYDTVNGNYRLEIGKRRSVNPTEYELIETVLTKLGFTFRYEQDRRFVVSGKHLVAYVRQFGKSQDKYVPQYILTGGMLTRRAFFDAITTMDHGGDRDSDSFIYSSASKVLAEQVGWLAITLGYAVTYYTRQKEDENPQYQVIIRKATTAYIAKQHHGEQYQEEDYDGYVYCAAVSGELLMTRRNGKTFWSGNSIDAVPDEARAVQPSHLGYIDLLRTPESFKAGVDSRVSYAAKKGSDNRIYTPFWDPKTRQMVYKSPQDVADLKVAFPGEMENGRPLVRAQVGGQTRYIPREQVNLVLPHMEQSFSPINNLVPMKSAVKGQRAAMASRFITQALPLRDAEAPLVRGQVPGMPGRSFEEHYGHHMGAVKAVDQSGRVTKVTPDAVTVKYSDGTQQTHELYNNFPYNRKTFVHNTPLVRVGDMVQPKQLLAKSNYTDDKGAIALGKNLRVAYIPFRGLNYEDAYVVSASAAKKLSSEHMYQHNMEWDEKHRRGRKEFVSIFPSTFQKDQLKNVDDEGIVKPGTVIQPGDPLILAAKERELTKKQVHAAHKGSFMNDSLTWDHHSPGVVTDVEKTDKGVTVAVKSLNPSQVGDKISGRYGDKGVIASIIPDEEMPQDEQGRPFEVLANPLGITSRTNPAQKFEAALGKIAEKTKNPYTIEDFSQIKDLNEHAMKELAKHGLSLYGDVLDPTMGRRIPNVASGNRYFMKLHHTSESKGQGRGLGGYTAEGMPAKGGPEGCFAADQLIMTIDGPMKIGHICDKQLSVQVRCFDFQRNEWLYRPVTDWFTYRAKVADMLTVKTIDGRALHVTPNHLVYSPDGTKVEIGKLGVGSTLTTWGPIATEDQLSFLFGTLLGDASVNENAFTCEHSVKQCEYVNWKQQILAGLGAITYDRKERKKLSTINGKPVKSDLSRVVSVGEASIVNRLRAVCYTGSQGRKQITEQWLSMLNGLSVALWVLDDGSITNRAKKAGQVHLTGNIATHGFTTAERYKLAGWLQLRYGAGCTPLSVGSLCLSAELCQKLIFEIAEWVPWEVIPGSKRFLKMQVRIIQNSRPPRLLAKHCRLGLVPLEIKSIEPFKLTKPDIDEINVYDFTVAGTHNYCAGHTLVSNSKRMAMMDVNAMLSHGAIENLRDVKLIKGQKNQEYWSTYMAGNRPPTPNEPEVYKKFINTLKAGGVNVTRKGSQLHILNMTDKDVQAQAGDRELENADTVDWKAGMSPVKGGLFDERLTGGHNGDRWAKITLHEPMPNPVMEEPIRRLLNLTQDKFEKVLAGKESLNGKTGPRAVQDALNSIDLDQTIAQARADIASGKRTARDNAIRKLGPLVAAKEHGLHPKDWMLKAVPVLPPKFRPVSIMQGTGGRLVSDANYLYKELFDANQNLKDLSKISEDVGHERLTLYNAFKGVTGLGDPVHPKNQERKVKGMLAQIFSSSPKFGMVQQKLLGTTVDLVGRSVVVPNPDLNMDEVGLPENHAWEIYTPFIVRRLVRRGVPRIQALDYVKNRHELAKKAMLEEIGERPVIVTRAPVLHRYGLMAFYPRLTKGDTLQISPPVVGGFGMDFDGDASNYHVPASDEARDEAVEKLLPSKNLLSAQKFQVHQLPRQEYVAGLWSATQPVNSEKRPRIFATERDAIKAFERGELHPNDPVRILKS